VEVTHQTNLATDLGFDSLMMTELTAALEEAGVPAQTAEGLAGVQTVGDLARLVGGAVHRAAPERAPAEPEERKSEEIAVPAPVAALGRRLLGLGQRALYQGLYDTKIVGAANIPHDRNVLVVANHSSHLDMGLVKVALGDEGRRLAALAARDYFFDTPVKRAYFENFTNLIPMDREGSLKASLKAAAEALRRGYHLLIFPEGTRSRDGRMKAFFPTAGYLALQCNVDVLPAYIHGTHEALPPGRLLPRSAGLEVRFGQRVSVADLRARVASLPRSESYRVATQVIEDAVRALRDGRASSTATAASEAVHPERSADAPAAARSRGAATATSTASPTRRPHARHDVPTAASTASTPEDDGKPGRPRREPAHAHGDGPAPAEGRPRPLRTKPEDDA
jgi:long-chain acyl-CoA synthetase